MADVQKDIVLRVKSETDQATGQFKNLKQELRSIENELNKMAEAGQSGTEAFKKLQQRAGEVKDQVGDTKAAIKALSSDTFRLDAFAQGAQAIAGGFAAAQGALALFGTENKQVEEAIKKTQGAMALLQGVTAITNVLQKESALRLAIATTAQTAYTAVVGASSGAMKIFRLALASTGIGALVVGLGLLIANFEDVKKVVMNLLKPFDGIIAKVRDFLSVISFGLIDDSATAKTKDNAEQVVDAFNKTKDAMKESEKAIERQIELAKAQGKSTKEIYLLEKQLADLRIKNLQAEQSALKTKEKAGTATEDEKKRLKELVSEIADANNKRLILDANYQKAVSDANKKAKEKAEADAKKEREEKAKKDAEIKKQQEQNAKDFQDRTNKEFEDSKKSSDDYYDHLINVAKVNGQSTEELELQKLQNLLQIQKDYGQSTIALEDQIALKKKEISDKQLEQQRAQLEIQRQDYSQSYNQIKTILDNAYKTGLITQKQYNEATKQLDSAQLQGKMALTKAVADLFGSLSDALGKETKAGKALATAQALINTYLGISEVLRAKNPYPEPFGTAVKIASAATIGINGFNTVRSINKVQVPGGGGGGPVGSMPNLSTAPSAMATTTPTIGSTQLQLDAQGNLQQGSMRTYVLETDISDKQKRSQRLQRTATLGK
jgi:DNA repair exonuclease SbcCD ATPase subunit